MKRILIGIILLTVLSITGGIVSAQLEGYAIDGLVANLDGDLYEWDGTTLTPLTRYGYNDVPVQSPDGRYIAYLSVAEEAINSSNFAGGARPMNIWLLDRQNGSFQPIADSASGLKFRGKPSWSPDSTQLAWTELASGVDILNTVSLMKHDITTNTQTTLTNNFTLGPSDGGLYMRPVQWGDAGITQVYSTVIMGPNPGQMLLELYNPDNGTMTSYTIGSTLDSYILDYVWAMHNGEEWLAFITRNGDWWVLNPRNGVREDLANPPTRHTLYGISNLQMTPRLTPNNDFMWDVTFLYHGGTPAETRTLPYVSPLVRDHFAPAIGGNGFIWNGDSELAIQRADGVQMISTETGTMPYRGAVWYSTVWQTNMSPAASAPIPTSETTDCVGGALYGPGNQIRIQQGVPNNLRSAPTTNSVLLGQLPAGTGMTVLEEATCNEGYYWYRVQGTEWTGWTAAGPNHAWIERIPGTPVETCPLPPRLQLGQLARITDGIPNNLRTEPSLSAPITAQLPAGTIMEIQNDPACVDGMYWYQVLGTEWQGWTAEGQNGVYWMEPFSP